MQRIIAAVTVMLASLSATPSVVIAQGARALPEAPAVADACFDYNGPLLPGRSRPWLIPLTLGILPNLPAGLDPRSCLPGTFLYDNRYGEDVAASWSVTDIPVGPDGCPLDIRDAYERLMELHPQLGGTPPRHLTKDELEALGISENGGACFTDASPGTSAGTTPPLRSNDELLAWYATNHISCLSEIPPRIVAGLDAGPAGGCASTSPAPSPTPRSETRRYRVSVNGYENVIPDQYWRSKGGVRKGVRFDYRLVGEFELARAGPSAAWKVTNERVVVADLRYSSLYPVDGSAVTLTCLPRCERFRTGVRLYVTPEGDEVVIGWRPFFPAVRAIGSCSACTGPVKSDYVSDFWQRVTGARLPLQDSFTSQPTRVVNASGDITLWFAHGLERRP